MDERISNYKVFIKTNTNNEILAVISSAFLTNTEGWIEIDSGTGDKYHHAQNNYFDGPLIDFGFRFPIYNYVLRDGVVLKKTTEEKESEVALKVQNQIEHDMENSIKKMIVPDIGQIHADLQYIAMMTGVDI